MHSRPVQTFPYLFPQHMAPTGSCLQFPAIVQSFAVLWEQEAGKQEMCQGPRSHPGAGKRAFHYPKSCGFFRKDDSTNTRQFAPSFCVLSNNKVEHEGNIFQPPALSEEFVYRKRGTASQRFSMFELGGSLALEL